MADREQPAQRNVRNQLLRALPPASFARLAPKLECVGMPLGMRLACAGDPIATVCFPEEGVVAFAGSSADGEDIATGLIGREGFVGWPLLLHNDRWPHDPIVRATDGSALRMDARDLLTAMDDDPAIRTVLLRSLNGVIGQMAQTIASHLLHDVERRLARWILLYHDRVTGDEIVLTHKELGLMLGVRRSSITDALHRLESEAMIRGRRGRFTVLNRKKLETMAGETYGFAESEHARLLGSDDAEQVPEDAAPKSL